MTVDDLLNSFMRLDSEQRSEFLLRAYEASQTLPFDAAWLEEIRSRSAEVDAGRMPLHDWDEARTQIHNARFPHA